MKMKWVWGVFLPSSLIVCLLLSCAKKVSEEVQPQLPITSKSTSDGGATQVVYKANPNYIMEDTALVLMFKAIAEQNESGNVKGIIDSTQLRRMFSNLDNPFYRQDLNKLSNVKLVNNVNPLYVNEILPLFKRISVASRSQTVASPGVAGVLSERLLDEKGFALFELIEKNLMGSFQLYQICSVHLSPAQLSATDTAALLRNWDKAFAILGVTSDFANYRSTYPGLRFWGHYFEVNDLALGNNVNKIMNAFASGRSAIREGNKTIMNENAKIIQTELERTAAGMVVSYLKKAKLGTTHLDMGLRNGSLTEALGFLYILRNHPTKKINDTQLNTCISKLNVNCWNVAIVDVDAIVATVSGIYGFDSTRF